MAVWWYVCAADLSAMCWTSVLFQRWPGVISSQFCYYNVCDSVWQLLSALHLLQPSKRTDRFTGRPHALPSATERYSSTYSIVIQTCTALQMFWTYIDIYCHQAAMHMFIWWKLIIYKQIHIYNAAPCWHLYYINKVLKGKKANHIQANWSVNI